MAKKHFNKINKIITQLETLQSEVDSLRDTLQDKFNSMSDSRQESNYGEDLQNIINLLDAASCDGLEICCHSCNQCLTHYETTNLGWQDSCHHSNLLPPTLKYVY